MELPLHRRWRPIGMDVANLRGGEYDVDGTLCEKGLDVGLAVGSSIMNYGAFLVVMGDRGEGLRQEKERMRK
ncbi:hypothetical protein LWI28_006932 [Acer negundo]|uniref:Uncharacterized protein n=1 Tax=Acer negundo TaxID=4023 RepID=A0AAD5I9F9_ACENE|nr:hypothetical protein LWI28_006932 [Acer negundo]KAK4836001.1 hypothetical protein QYF36_017295 [Acer negundo]